MPNIMTRREIREREQVANFYRSIPPSTPAPAKLIATTLFLHSDNGAGISLSSLDVSKACGESPRTVSRWLKYLRDRGWLVSEGQTESVSGQRTKYWRLLVEKMARDIVIRRY
jgi:DNA-binding transcriptional ArsR family regulator